MQMHRSIALNTPAAAEPITLDELKAHGRIGGNDEDALLTRYQKGTRRTLENMLGLTFLETVWDEYYDYFPKCDPITLYRAPVLQVDLFEYYNTSNQLTALVENTNFELDKVSQPARIMPVYGSIWPATRPKFNAVHIRYRSGFASAAAIPEDLINLLFLFFQVAYEMRLPINEIGGLEEVPAPVSICQLIANNRVWGF